jgi:integrase
MRERGRIRNRPPGPSAAPRAPPAPQPQLPPPHPGGREQAPPGPSSLHRHRAAAGQLLPRPRPPDPRRRAPARAHPGLRRRPAWPLQARPAHNRYRGLHAFFTWAWPRATSKPSPDGRRRPPQLPEQPVEVVRAEQLTRLLKTCAGRDFTSRRDTAILPLLVDTGMRRAECVGRTLDDGDLDQRIVGCWARATDPGRCRSVARPPKHSTATCGRERGICSM